MSTMSVDDVWHLAQLSSLQLSEDEARDLQVDLANILGYIGQLSSLDTSSVEPTYQITGLENVWRDDRVSDGDVTREVLLALAPESDGHSIKVPKVL